MPFNPGQLLLADGASPALKVYLLTAAPASPTRLSDVTAVLSSIPPTTVNYAQPPATGSYGTVTANGSATWTNASTSATVSVWGCAIGQGNPLTQLLAQPAQFGTTNFAIPANNGRLTAQLGLQFLNRDITG